jgi:meso-butanediol dehydrogenase/(S,S)-butanediol dehydrogenase/diacetyl reductase
LTGVFYGCKAALPAMMQRGGGVIINTSSIEAFGAEMLASPYCAAKAAVVNFTKSVAIEYARKGIRANALCPGIVETPLFEMTSQFFSHSKEQMQNLSPMGRFLQPEEMAAIVSFLASDDSSAITGQAIVADGGITSMLNLGGHMPLGA